MKTILLIIALIFFVGVSCYLFGERQMLRENGKLQYQIDHYKTTWIPLKGKEGKKNAP
jgi:uncharacterized protein YxeA